MLNPATIFSKMITATNFHIETERERNRKSSEIWRAKQNPSELKQKQRSWEKNYRAKLKADDPPKYTAYCRGSVNA